MKSVKRISALILALGVVFSFSSCSDEEVANPTPQSVIDSFYTAWQKSDTNTIISLTCEPMWEVEAKSADVSVEELKSSFKQSYADASGSEVYYKILETKEYEIADDKYKETAKWANERYKIEIEGYAVIRVAVTYDKGEPVTENMEIIKYNGSWYAKDLLGI